VSSLRFSGKQKEYLIYLLSNTKISKNVSNTLNFNSVYTIIQLKISNMHLKNLILYLILLFGISNTIYTKGGSGHGCASHCRVHGSRSFYSGGRSGSGFCYVGYHGSHKKNHVETEEEKRIKRIVGWVFVLFLLYFCIYQLLVALRPKNCTREKLTDAINDGCRQKVTELLRLGIDVNSYDYWGATPLSLAVQKKYLDIVRVLLKSGSDVTKSAAWYKTPLSIAVLKKNKAIFNLLVKEHRKYNKRSYIDKIILFFLKNK
jgi:hypothetical protein